MKIALNNLVAYYPHVWSERDKLLPAIRFVVDGAGTVPFVVTHPKTDLDKVPTTHNVFLYNHKKGSRIRVSLYNGAFKIVFLFPRLLTLDIEGPGRLLVDYVKMKNIFQGYEALAADLNCIQS